MRNFLVLTIGMTLMMISCVTPPDVVQSTVVSCDENAKIVVIRDQDNPGGTLEFSFDDAEVGANPQPGDTVRIAYRRQNDKLKATRIMNISRQKELNTGH
jgi:hypothetical protein